MKHLPDTSTLSKKLVTLAAGREILTLSMIRDASIPSNIASRLVANGRLERVGPGLYRLPNAPISEHHDLLRVTARSRTAVIVLLSALRFHELGTQQPRSVWIQIPAHAQPPQMDWPALTVVRTRIPELLTEGVDLHTIANLNVPITNPARTVADCFKHRNRIGLDVCLEALTAVLQRDRTVMDALYRYAKMNRVQNIMQPYLERTP